MEAAADWDNLRTAETYLGYSRSAQSAPADAQPERLLLNEWALEGEWTVESEKVVLDQAGGSIAFRFQARDAHLVLSGGAREPIPFRVLIDGEPPGPSHGVDVDEEGNGELREGRMYQLAREHGKVRERTRELIFSEPGAQASPFPDG